MSTFIYGTCIRNRRTYMVHHGQVPSREARGASARPALAQFSARARTYTGISRIGIIRTLHIVVHCICRMCTSLYASIHAGPAQEGPGGARSLSTVESAERSVFKSVIRIASRDTQETQTRHTISIQRYYQDPALASPTGAPGRPTHRPSYSPIGGPVSGPTPRQQLASPHRSLCHHRTLASKLIDLSPPTISMVVATGPCRAATSLQQSYC